MKLKVCGITQLAQLQALQDLGVDYAGLIFYPQSKRFVAEKVSTADAQSVLINKVGVFVDAELESIKKKHW